MERKIGFSSLRALSNASSLQEYQSTGFVACCKRYGLFSSMRRLYFRPFSCRLSAIWFSFAPRYIVIKYKNENDVDKLVSLVFLVSLVSLVSLVHLVCFVCLVYLVLLVYSVHLVCQMWC